jgi:hypothetical protein
MASEELRNTDYPATESVWLELVDDEVEAVTMIEVRERPNLSQAHRLVSPIVERRRVVMRALTVEQPGQVRDMTFWPPGEYALRVGISRRRGSNVGSLVEAAQDTETVLIAVRDREASGSVVKQLLLGARPDLLIGMVEDAGLETKQSPYQLDHSLQEYELAKDVAAMANGKGGVIALGLRSRSSREGDRIVSVNPFPPEMVEARRYRRVMDRLVFPPLEDIRIDKISLADDQAIVVIEVPPQPEPLKPFLVHGAVREDKVSGAFFAAYERRGEETRHSSAAELHALLSAGRSAFRRPEELEGERSAEKPPSS